MIWKICQQTQPLIEKLNINQDEKGKGYSAAGTRNVSACIGNKVCPKAQYNTTNFARRIEKARMHDFGIIGTCLTEYWIDV